MLHSKADIVFVYAMSYNHNRLLAGCVLDLPVCVLSEAQKISRGPGAK